MSWTLCTSAAAIIKAGNNVHSDMANGAIINGVTNIDLLSDQAEGRIEAETRRKWVANYATLTSGAQNILADVCSSLIAIKMIAYDMSGYTSRQEATTMLDVNSDIADNGLRILKDFKSNSFQTP